MFTVTIDDRKVQERLQSMLRASADLEPVMKRFGEHLRRSSDDNFRAEQAPDGKPWKHLHPATLKSKRRRGKAGLKILSEGGNLRGNINYRTDRNSVTIGSPEPYAAIHQFGGKAGRGRAATIPARPFIGIGPDDRRELLQLLRDHLRLK